MNIRYYKWYSHCLDRDMEFKIYGQGGRNILFFPCQGGRFFDFENFKMLNVFAPWIERGECTVIAADSIDNEGWANPGWDNHQKLLRHEAWVNYICYELVPGIHQETGRGDGIMTFGCSMGAMHAANLYYRHPDLFNGCMALSGLYDNRLFFDNYSDELLYRNCPVQYLANLPWDHPYRAMYNCQRSLVVVGQGAWEEPLLESTRALDTVCCRCGIPTRFEYWGYDVSHDWCWWYKMVETYLPQML